MQCVRLKDWTNLSVWGKTTLITGGVGGAEVDPPSWKIGGFSNEIKTEISYLMIGGYLS